jgi:hypothetical protein
MSDNHKLWGGRFSVPTAHALDALNRSIGTDFRLWPFDIKLSQAWAAALERAGVYTAEECATVVKGLDAVAQRIAKGEQPIETDEDIHTMIDRLLHQEVGDPASKLHTGRSRNDQVATATRLWAMDAAASLDSAIRELQRVMVRHAEEQRQRTGCLITSGRYNAIVFVSRMQPRQRRYFHWDLVRSRGAHTLSLVNRSVSSSGLRRSPRTRSMQPEIATLSRSSCLR